MSGAISLDELFDRARAVRVEDVAVRHGALLRVVRGVRASGSCPVCGGDKGSTRFTIDLKRNLWTCWACPPDAGKRAAGGDAVALEHRKSGGTRIDAALTLTGLTRADLADTDAGLQARRREAAAASVSSDGPGLRPARTFDTGLALWREATSARGSLVEAWLTGRGLNLEVLPDALDILRFHPAAPAAWVARRVALSAPAMLAPIVFRTDTGWSLRGVQITYLSRDGSQKARLVHPETHADLPARKMFGATLGGCVPLSRTAAILTADLGPLYVGEGLESTWSLAQRLSERASGWIVPASRAVATLSLNNLQGGWLRDRDGCFDPSAPVCDPSAPPFTVPDPGAVILGVDSDMAPVKAWVRDPVTGQRCEQLLDSFSRADQCAKLAAQAWRAAGAASVRVLRPPLGQDFNDVVRGVAA